MRRENDDKVQLESSKTGEVLKKFFLVIHTISDLQTRDIPL